MLSFLSLRYLATRGMLLQTRRSSLGDATIHLPPGGSDQDQLAVSRLHEATELTRRWGSRPVQPVGRYLKHLVLAPDQAFRGEYYHPLRLCHLDIGYLTAPATTDADVACLLVHEAQHARLLGLGIPYTERNRLRVEENCVRAAIAFAQRLPDSTELVARHERQLASVTAVWDTRQLIQLRLASMRSLGAPLWLLRTMSFLWRVPSNKRMKLPKRGRL